MYACMCVSVRVCLRCVLRCFFVWLFEGLVFVVVVVVVDDRITPCYPSRSVAPHRSLGSSSPFFLPDRPNCVVDDCGARGGRS